MSKPRRCPKCCSRLVDYSELAFSNKQNTGIIAKGYCYSCNAHFIERYDTGFKGSNVYTDNPYDGSVGAPVSYPEDTQ